jgi:rhodanese-related sulfurtransferase
MKTASDMIDDAKAKVKQVSATSLVNNPDPDVVFIDCRELNEWNLGHIPGAIYVPRGRLEQRIEEAVDRDKKIVIYCHSGNRSALAADTMQQMGYKDVASMSGGIQEWADAGGEIEP